MKIAVRSTLTEASGANFTCRYRSVRTNIANCTSKAIKHVLDVCSTGSLVARVDRNPGRLIESVNRNPVVVAFRTLARFDLDRGSTLPALGDDRAV